MLLIRQALKRGWDIPGGVKKAIVRGLVASVEGQSPRHVVAAARTLLAIDASSRPAGKPRKRRRGRSA
jgi:hypothetical protein